MKEKYVKPVSKDLSKITPYAEGRCIDGSVAVPQGFSDCVDGSQADGGLCYDGNTVFGCNTGFIVTNYCSTGGNVG